MTIDFYFQEIVGVKNERWTDVLNEGLTREIENLTPGVLRIAASRQYDALFKHNE